MSDELIRSLKGENEQLRVLIEMQNGELQEWAEKFESAVNAVKIELGALSPEAEFLRSENEQLCAEIEKLRALLEKVQPFVGYTAHVPFMIAEIDDALAGENKDE